MTDILTYQPQGARTDLSEGLTWLAQASKRKTVAFVISDFLATGYDKALRVAARKHDLVPVVIADPLEDTFPALGLVDLEDPETGERWTVDTSDPRIRGRFTLANAKRREERDRAFKKLRLDSVELKAHEDYAVALQRFFRMRARRMAA